MEHEDSLRETEDCDNTEDSLSESNSELDAELEIDLNKTYDEIQRIDMPEKAYQELVKKFKSERIIYLTRVITIALLVGIALYYCYNFRKWVFASFLMLLIPSWSMLFSDNTLMKIDKETSKFMLDKDNLEYYVGVLTAKATIKKDVYAMYFNDNYILVNDNYSYQINDENEIVLIIRNRNTLEYKLRNLNDILELGMTFEKKPIVDKDKFNNRVEVIKNSLKNNKE